MPPGSLVPRQMSVAVSDTTTVFLMTKKQTKESGQDRALRFVDS